VIPGIQRAHRVAVARDSPAAPVTDTAKVRCEVVWRRLQLPSARPTDLAMICPSSPDWRFEHPCRERHRSGQLQRGRIAQVDVGTGSVEVNAVPFFPRSRPPVDQRPVLRWPKSRSRVAGALTETVRSDRSRSDGVVTLSGWTARDVAASIQCATAVRVSRIAAAVVRIRSRAIEAASTPLRNT